MTVDEKLREWYQECCPIAAFADARPIADEQNHTMRDSLRRYCGAKIPQKVVDLFFGCAPRRGRPARPPHDIFLVGTVEEHYAIAWEALQRGEERAPLPKPDQEIFLRKDMSRTKAYNYLRPRFYAVSAGDEPFIVITAFPGQDLVRHYFQMLQFLILERLRRLGRGRERQVLDRCRAVEFPHVREHIWEWADRNGTLAAALAGTDVAILGHIKDVDRLMQGSADSFTPEPLDNRAALMPSADSKSMFGWYRYRVTSSGKRVCLLGFKYSYWGDIVYHLAKGIFANGVSLILYVAKLGTLRSLDDLYTTAFIPNRFYRVKGRDRFLYDKFANPLVTDTFRLPSGGGPVGHCRISLPKDCCIAPHASIPTVLDETFVVREELERLGVASIDNEISYIAQAATEHNDLFGATPVAFSALHFATDYLRKETDPRRMRASDLADHRTPQNRRRRDAILRNNVEQILFPFLRNYGSPRSLTITTLEDSRSYLNAWNETALALHEQFGDAIVTRNLFLDDLATLTGIVNAEKAVFGQFLTSQLVLVDWYLQEDTVRRLHRSVLDAEANPKDDGAPSAATLAAVKNLLSAPDGMVGQLCIDRFADYLAAVARDAPLREDQVPFVVVCTEEYRLANFRMPVGLWKRLGHIHKNQLRCGPSWPTRHERKKLERVRDILAALASGRGANGSSDHSSAR